MNKGNWVIITNYNDEIDETEGEIIDIYRPRSSNEPIYKVRLESGKIIGCGRHQASVIEKHINYYALADIALSPLDKGWLQEISTKMKELA